MLGVPPASAEPAASASVRVQCSGAPGARVALKWRHPDVNSGAQVLPLFITLCNGNVHQQPDFPVPFRDSEIEVQTEGGIQTAYAVEVTIQRGPTTLGRLHLHHRGSPEVTNRAPHMVQLTRSAGPSTTGEQNFRVRLLDRPSAAATIVARSAGDRSDAQLALRWGHRDYHENEYFPTWTVPAGPMKRKDAFPLNARESEFEIQTEGGERTAYNVSIWIDQDPSMLPTIELVHRLTGTDIAFEGSGATFTASSGENAYGEMNVRVSVPSIPAP
jgi:hypothetical protein